MWLWGPEKELRMHTGHCPHERPAGGEPACPAPRARVRAREGHMGQEGPGIAGGANRPAHSPGQEELEA